MSEKEKLQLTVNSQQSTTLTDALVLILADIKGCWAELQEVF